VLSSQGLLSRLVDALHLLVVCQSGAFVHASLLVCQLSPELQMTIEPTGVQAPPFYRQRQAAARLALVTAVGKATLVGVALHVRKGRAHPVVAFPEPQLAHAGRVDEHGAAG